VTEPRKSPRDGIRAHYEPRLTEDRENFDILDWASADSQVKRFDVLAERVALKGRSLLDVGCGLGDLYAYLQRRRLEADYTGVDLLEKMVEAARRRHPDARFLCADVFADAPFEPRSFDVTFCSGALNLNLGNNRQFLPRAATRMVELARSVAVLNLLHARAQGSDERYFYFRPEEVLELLSDVPCVVEIVQGYLPNDFTVLCRPFG